MASSNELLLLLLFFAIGAVSSSAANPATITEVLNISPNHLTAKSYLSFMADIDYAVSTCSTQRIRGHPVLPTQTLRTTPPCWIRVNITNDSGERLLTLAHRGDNLYLSGYEDRAGSWRAFAGQERTLPGSSALSYAGDYGSIFGRFRGFKGLASVPVNRVQALANALVMANFPSSGADDTKLKPSLAFFILSIAEAERFPDIRAAIAAAMDAPAPRTIGGRLAELAVNWWKFSCALLYWDAHGQTGVAWRQTNEAREIKDKFSVHSPEQALAKIQPVLRSTRCTMT